jgi:hypothetical protein
LLVSLQQSPSAVPAGHVLSMNGARSRTRLALRFVLILVLLDVLMRGGLIMRRDGSSENLTLVTRMSGDMGILGTEVYEDLEIISSAKA